MKANHKKKALTFGDLIATVYDTCGPRRARKIIRRAVNEHVIVFQGRQRYLMS